MPSTSLVSKRQLRENKFLLGGPIVGIFLLVNILYFTRLIPPIPLSLKEAGAYYSVGRDSQGNYRTVGELETWRDYFKLYRDFHFLPDQPVYVYTAVFSPPLLNINIVHEWQFYNESSKKWETQRIIPLKVIGGRDGGFRTYSERSGLAPGHWRVNVLTSGGQVIGRVRFNLIPANTLPHVTEQLRN